MGERICEKTRWHEMEGPFIGGREHYQEKSYGFRPKWEPSTGSDAAELEREKTEIRDEQETEA